MDTPARAISMVNRDEGRLSKDSTQAHGCLPRAGRSRIIRLKESLGPDRGAVKDNARVEFTLR